MLRCFALAAFFFALLVIGSYLHWNGWVLLLPAVGFVIFFLGFGVAIIEEDRSAMRHFLH